MSEERDLGRALQIAYVLVSQAELQEHDTQNDNTLKYLHICHCPVYLVHPHQRQRMGATPIPEL